MQTIVKQRLGWGHPPILDMATKSNQNKAVGAQYKSNSNTSLTLGLYSLSGSMFVVLAIIKAPAWCALVCQNWQIHLHCAHSVVLVHKERRAREREREREKHWMFYWLGLGPISVEVCTCQSLLRWILLVYVYKHACILKAYIYTYIR